MSDNTILTGIIHRNDKDRPTVLFLNKTVLVTKVVGGTPEELQNGQTVDVRALNSSHRNPTGQATVAIITSLHRNYP